MAMPVEPLVLASSSLARLTMLKAAGVPIETQPARIDEATIKTSMLAEGYPPRDVADALAEAKARKISDKLPGVLVLGADQILIHDGEIFDKPKTLERARVQLTTLRGSSHRLLSAAVMIRNGDVTFRHIQTVKMTMRNFSDEFLADYLDQEGEAILSCVGAYRLEGLGAQLFSHIDGDYFTVLGLPLLPCLDHLRIQGILRP